MTTSRFRLSEKSASSSNRSPPGPILDPRLKRSKEQERFLWSFLSTARIASGRGSASNLSGVVRKPHVPSSMAYILYALVTLLILTRLISPHQISTLYLLPKKKKTFGLISCFTQLESLSLLFPLHRFFVFVFLLEFLICKRERTCSYHSWMCCPISLQRVVRYYKGTGREAATLCYANAVLRYAMHARCGGHYEKCRDNGKGLLASRGGLQGPRLNVHNLSSYKKSLKSILKVRLSRCFS